MSVHLEYFANDSMHYLNKQRIIRNATIKEFKSFTVNVKTKEK